MFPTSGFFRSNNCPYYLSGLCERPYCHFRHMKQEERSTLPVRPAQQTSKFARQESSTSPAKHSGRSRQPSSLSKSDGGGGGGNIGDEADDDYTPTPLSVLRRAKVQQPEAPPPQPQPPAELPTYEPTPLTVTQPQQPMATARRRPLQLPAPKLGESSSSTLSTMSSKATPGDGEVYDPTSGGGSEALTVDESRYSASKRMRHGSVSPKAGEVSYEPTPISSGGYDQDQDSNPDDENDDEYCPTAIVSAPATSIPDQLSKTNEQSSQESAGGEIKRVFLDLFGEEPDEAAATRPEILPTRPTNSVPPAAAAAASSQAASTSISASNYGRAGSGIRRMTPSEQVARRTQHLAANPSALLSQGKVRAPSSLSAALASSSGNSAAPSPIIVAVAASPLAGTVANKIPDVVRQRYLDRLAEECRLIVSASGASVSADTGSSASRRAQQLELECYERSANRNVYLNAVILAIKRVRASGPDSSGNQQQRQQQPEEASQLSDKRLHKHLLKYALTPSQLAENRYPPNLPPLPYAPPANPLERLCVRCGTAFLLQRPQLSIPPGQCCYHYGRAYSRRMPGAGVQQIYSCCGGDIQAKGCSLCERHVHEYNVYCDTDGYRDTLAPDKATVSKKQRRAVFALDCEMIYTEAGKELARVTVIDRSLKVVYDRIVRPSAPIVDCNTRFSGLREEQLASAQHQLADVQDELFKLIYSTCILIGHSLESDLQVLKLRHPTVVDTSIVFPHRQGPPKKRALRNLASEILNKIIQAGGDAGHDSSEDARTCMELMFHKLTEDLKKVKFGSSG